MKRRKKDGGIYKGMESIFFIFLVSIWFIYIYLLLLLVIVFFLLFYLQKKSQDDLQETPGKV